MWRAQKQRIAVVPTMGALHAGHVSLLRLARQHADRVILTLFVNPLQFNDSGDLARYPRREKDDAAIAADEGVDLTYIPAPDVMFGSGFCTSVTVGGISGGLCGAARPGHFAGVATIVTKLLLQASADVAIFGEKDFQQLQVIRRLVADLDVPVEIVAGATARESDGLALSSRNLHLSPTQRLVAPALYRELVLAGSRLRRGQDVSSSLVQAAEALLSAGFAKVDYFELCDAGNLKPLKKVQSPSRLLAAAWLGETRLIDNIDPECEIGGR